MPQIKGNEHSKKTGKEEGMSTLHTRMSGKHCPSLNRGSHCYKNKRRYIPLHGLDLNLRRKTVSSSWYP
jgi:hypothetical protein